MRRKSSFRIVQHTTQLNPIISSQYLMRKTFTFPERQLLLQVLQPQNVKVNFKVEVKVKF